MFLPVVRAQAIACLMVLAFSPRSLAFRQSVPTGAWPTGFMMLTSLSTLAGALAPAGAAWAAESGTTMAAASGTTAVIMLKHAIFPQNRRLLLDSAMQSTPLLMGNYPELC